MPCILYGTALKYGITCRHLDLTNSMEFAIVNHIPMLNRALEIHSLYNIRWMNRQLADVHCMKDGNWTGHQYRVRGKGATSRKSIVIIDCQTSKTDA